MDKAAINAIEYRDGGLWIALDNRAMARRISIEIGQRVKAGKRYDMEIKLHRKLRSNTANSYCWVLLGKLASVLQIPKEEIYRDLIRNIGDNFEILSISHAAVHKFCRSWRQRGEGWIAEPTGSHEVEGFDDVILYYGSSTYDTAQMSRLIDLLVQECREQGIETLPPYKLDALKEGWNAQTN